MTAFERGYTLKNKERNQINFQLMKILFDEQSKNSRNFILKVS